MTLTENNIITVYMTTHDSNVTFVDKNNRLTTIEYDRWKNKKYCRPLKHDVYFPEKLKQAGGVEDFLKFISVQIKNPKAIRKIITAANKTNVIFKDNKTCPESTGNRLWHTDKSLIKKYTYDSYVFDMYRQIYKKLFPNAEVIFKSNHHYAHAAGAYYQAPEKYKNCLIFSYDGAGETNLSTSKEPKTVEELLKVRGVNHNTGFLFRANNFNSKYGIKFIKTFKPQRYGGLYTIFSTKLKIKYPNGKVKPVDVRRLGAPGKFMGYTAYGTPQRELIEKYKQWWRLHKTKPGVVWEDKTTGGIADTITNYTEIEAPNVAASAQAAFEEIIEELLFPIIKEKKLPLIITGGCALNVLVNQRLAKKIKTELNLDVFVCNNPSDAGISQGMFFLEFPKKRNDLIYNGINMIDTIEPYIKKYNIKEHSLTDVVREIKKGKIIGCAHDGSELGPRALGNRSIICKPDPEMKDKLNAKIKFREWYRPFGPVCRVEDKDKYFDNAFESPYMSFAPTVKPEYREKLKSITHIDGTARLQTVTRKQNYFFYNILCEMEQLGMIPVLLNTSFNIKGKPILTRYSSAFEALETTQLDCLFLDKQYLIHKI